MSVEKSSGTSQQNGGLKQTLTLFDLVFFGLVSLVPLSPFAIYGSVFATSNGLPATAYVIAFICIFPTTLSFGVMIRAWQSSGSVFSYCYHCLGKVFGFIGGWMMMLQYFILPALVYTLSSQALNQIFPQIPVFAWAAIILAFVTVVSLLNIKATVTVNRIALIAELIVWAMFVFFALRHILFGAPLDMHAASSASLVKGGFDATGLMAAVGLGMLSYVGFGSVATMTQQAKRPEKDPPRATVIIVVIVAVIFISTCLLARLIDPTGSLFANDTANGFYMVASAVGGEWFGTTCALSLALAMGVISGLAGVISITRVIYIMANAGALPKVFAKLDPKTNSPRNASILLAITSALLLFLVMALGTNDITDINNLGAMSTYVLVDICVVWYFGIHKNKLNGKKGNMFRMLIIPAFGAIALLVVMASVSHISQAIAVGWCLIGLGIYFFITKVRHKELDLGK